VKLKEPCFFRSFWKSIKMLMLKIMN